MRTADQPQCQQGPPWGCATNSTPPTGIKESRPQYPPQCEGAKALVDRPRRRPPRRDEPRSSVAKPSSLLLRFPPALVPTIDSRFALEAASSSSHSRPGIATDPKAPGALLVFHSMRAFELPILYTHWCVNMRRERE